MTKAIAEELAKKQREISVAEFFERNRHLLGFDNKRKALLTVVKEAVDNSLDACEEARVLPDIHVEIVDMGNDRFRVIVTDNGPGIVKKQIPNIFAKLLYGSKFHTMRQSLTADEPVMVHRNGKVDILPIGDLVDPLAGADEVKDIGNLDIRVPSFDREKKTYAWKRVSHVIRHKRQNEIICVKTSTGRTIKVTGCHSLFSYNEQNKQIVELEARTLRKGMFIVAPHGLPSPEETEEFNVLHYLTKDDVAKLGVYVYGVERQFIHELFSQATVVYKKTDKSRKYYRLATPAGGFVDVLEDSFRQYFQKGFLPLRLVLELDMADAVMDCTLVTYRHGERKTVPVRWPLTPAIMRFLGLFVAEGHTDIRQSGFTFGLHEGHLVDEICRTARLMGASVTVERRKTSYRIKIFGNIISLLLKAVCRNGAHNKRVPEFVFRTDAALRQHFLDALYQGYGCAVRGRNCLTLTTVSRALANDVLYLWLMQGVLACISSRTTKGFGKNPSTTYGVSVYGKDIAASHVYQPTENLRWDVASRPIESEINAGSSALILQQQHLCLVRVKDIELINSGYDYVYDLSVPGDENFVGGLGGIACHNSRGQQGIGISAAVLYAQLTTGRPARITSKIAPKEPAHYYELHVNTQTNQPEIVKEDQVAWNKDHGTKVELDIEANYQKGDQSVDSYLRETSIVNPHATIVYVNPKAEQLMFARATDKLPPQAKEIKPHPYGVELGIMMKMIKATESRTLQSFLTNEFSRVGSQTAHEICDAAGLFTTMKPSELQPAQIEKLMEGIKKTKIIAPSTDCIVPIGEQLLEKGLKKEVAAEFYVAVSRSPEVYKGIPFVVECALAYGGSQPADQPVTLLRFANRVPLLYQQSACALFKSVVQTNWKPYGMQQSQGALPAGPLTVAIHLASVWPPFTSEAKEAVAHYPEIIKEVKLALQEAGRKLSIYVHRKQRAHAEQERVGIFEMYIPEVAEALASLAGTKPDSIERSLKAMLKKNKEIIQQGLAVPVSEVEGTGRPKGSHDEDES